MKKRLLSVLLCAAMAVGMLAGCGSKEESEPAADGELAGDITFWHSFTQGPRLETIQKVADQFMEDNPKVNITIETFSGLISIQSGRRDLHPAMYRI